MTPRGGRHPRNEAFTSGWHHFWHENVGDAGAAQPAGAGAPDLRAAGDFSSRGAQPRIGAALDTADATARDRQLLARSSDPRRPPGARARRLERSAGRLALADWRQGPAGELSHGARALPRAPLCTRSGLLLHLRPTGVSLRLAPRPVGRRPQSPGAMAHRLRDGMAIVERPKRPRPLAAPPAGAALRAKRRAVMEVRRNRPSRAAVPGLGRAARAAVAGVAGLLGRA